MPENAKHLLLVDDEATLREAIAERLADHGFAVVQAATGEDALTHLAAFAIAIIITGFGTVKDAVEAIKHGAADFITKPFQFDALLHVLRSALEQRRLRSENAYLRSQLDTRYRIEGLVGKSPVMRDL